MSAALLYELSRVAHHDAIDALHRGESADGVHLLELHRTLRRDARDEARAESCDREDDR